VSAEGIDAPPTDGGLLEASAIATEATYARHTGSYLRTSAATTRASSVGSIGFAR
jgi:hypothetical protein